MQYVISFLEGIITFLSPCLLPMLPTYHDTDGEGVAVYNITAFPTTYFIDREGYIVARGIGAIPADGLKAGLDMARK